jgi:hypothetical protein
VIFDPLLGEKYLELTGLLGVEINLSKSIQSFKAPVFEFAKRTCIADSNVSPIPVKQLLSNDTLSGRVMNLVTFLQRDLPISNSIIGTTLSKFGTWKLLQRKKEYMTPLIATLGTMCSLNILSHRWLVESLINPKKGFEALEEQNLTSIPKVSVLKLIRGCGQVLAGVSDSLGAYPFSNESGRKEIYSDFEVEFCNVIANTAYTIAKTLLRDWDENLEKEAMNLVAPVARQDLDPVRKSQLIG